MNNAGLGSDLVSSIHESLDVESLGDSYSDGSFNGLSNSTSNLNNLYPPNPPLSQHSNNANSNDTIGGGNLDLQILRTECSDSSVYSDEKLALMLRIIQVEMESRIRQQTKTAGNSSGGGNTSANANVGAGSAKHGFPSSANEQPQQQSTPSSTSRHKESSSSERGGGEEDRGRPRADSIGPEIRRANALSRREAYEAAAAKSSSDAGVTAAVSEPYISSGRFHTSGGSRGSPDSRRPGAPIEKMFASALDNKDRAKEVEENMRQRDRGGATRSSYDRRPSDGVGVGLLGIDAMIYRDRKEMEDTASDRVYSIYSDTNSNFSGPYDDEDGVGADANENNDDEAQGYSKSPKQLSFADYRKPPSNIPNLNLSVLRSPRGERRCVTAPDPLTAKTQLTDGEKAFSPRSMTPRSIASESGDDASTS